MSTIDEQFVEFVVKSLVNHPDDVKIERTIDKLGVLIKLEVNPEDLGRVIGKRGATAQSLRTLLRALGTKNEARYNLKIIDNGDPRPDREAPDRETDKQDTSKEEPKEEEKAVAAEKPAKKEVEAEPKAETKAEPEAEPEEEDESLTKRTMAELDDLDDLEV